MNRYSRSDLQQLPVATLAKLAQEYGLPTHPSMESYALVQMILEAQEVAPARRETSAEEQSMFFGSQDEKGNASNEQKSTFFSQHSEVTEKQMEREGSVLFRTSPASNESATVPSEDKPKSINLKESIMINSTPGLPSSGKISADLHSGARKSKEHNLGPGDELVLGDTVYQILRIISDSSGEAIIYLVKQQDETLKVVKLYFEINPRFRPEPNGEALNRILRIDNPDILKLHSIGTGPNKYKGKYCFEVSTYAEGGNLLDVANFNEKYTVPFVEQHLIPEIFNGIKALHGRRIVHCDLKPQNIFFLDKEQQDLVIGDYGSAITFEEGSAQEQGGRQFSEVIGTRVYMAPEQNQGIISEANDYYSFGMILLHLFYPEHFALDRDQRVPDNGKKRRIIENQYSQKEIIPFNPAYDRINQLIGGLTLYAHGVRWGREEMEQWLKGKYLQVQYQGKSLVQPINLGRGVIIVTQKDLTTLFEREPERWYRDLILDTQGYSSLLNWLFSRTDLQVKQEFEQMVRYYRSYEDKYVKEAVLRYFSPERPIQIETKSFDFYSTEHIRSTVEAIITELDRHWKNTSLERIRFVFFQIEFCLRQAAGSRPAHSERYEAILQKISKALNLSTDLKILPYTTRWQNAISLDDQEKGYRTLLTLFYALLPNRNFRGHVYQEIRDVKTLGFFFAQDETLFQDNKLKLEAAYFLSKQNRPDLVAWLKDYDNFLFRVFAEEIRAKIEVHDVDVTPERTYLIEYSVWRSLTDFFQENTINHVLETQNKEKFHVTYQRPFFKSLSHTFNGFIATLSDRHQVEAGRIEKSNLTQERRRFYRFALPQELKYHAREWYSAAVLLAPVLFVLGLLLIDTNEGISLGQALWDQFGLNTYVLDSDVHRNNLINLYVLLQNLLLWYLAAIFAKIWLKEKLALLGDVRDESPALFHIQGFNGFKALSLAFVAPGLFWLSNWAYLFIGASMLIVAGFLVLGRIHHLSEIKRNIVGGLLILVGAGRFMTGSTGGIFDLVWMACLILVFFVIPIYYQHGKPSVGRGTWIKFGMLAVMAIIIIPNTNAYEEWKSFTVDTPPAVENTGVEENEVIEGAWLARVADGVQLVNIRAGQGTGYRVVGQVRRGEPFFISASNDPQWMKVNAKDKEGYIYYDKVAKIRPMKKSDLNTP